MTLLRTAEPAMKRLLAFALLVFTAALASAAGPQKREWTVNQVKREALVVVPDTAKTTASPVIFVFHGHGGTMQASARRMNLHTHWPEAIVVFPQGLNTKGQLTDPEGKKSGWQNRPGLEGDRDLAFFDAVLASLQADYKVDARRVYATGHSNGGGFTYLLWAVRGDIFAAVAPSASAASAANTAGLKFTPKPVMHLAGEKDTLVKYEWQKATMLRLRELNRCGEGSAWGPQYCTLYPSKLGTPVVTYIHPGGHEYPAGAPPVIVKFFKEHAQP